RSQAESSSVVRVRTCGCISPRNAIIVWIREPKKGGEGRRLLLAPRLRSQVQGGTHGNANDRQLCREDRERREVHADRQVDERFRDRKEHTSELQSRFDLVCRLLLEKKKKHKKIINGSPVYKMKSNKYEV